MTEVVVVAVVTVVTTVVVVVVDLHMEDVVSVIWVVSVAKGVDLVGFGVKFLDEEAAAVVVIEAAEEVEEVGGSGLGEGVEIIVTEEEITATAKAWTWEGSRVQ